MSDVTQQSIKTNPCIHSRCMRENESKVLSSQPLSCATDYQGIGVGKRLLNFIAELYTSQTKMLFYILTSNPQIIRGNLSDWKITRFGHASKGKEDTRINNEIRGSLSRKRINSFHVICLEVNFFWGFNFIEK